MDSPQIKGLKSNDRGTDYCLDPKRQDGNVDQPYYFIPYLLYHRLILSMKTYNRHKSVQTLPHDKEGNWSLDSMILKTGKG